MKLKFLWNIPMVLIGFTLILIPATYAQFTVQATANGNDFSTANSFTTPTPAPTLTPSPTPTLTPTPTPPCTDCDHDCDTPDSDDKCREQKAKVVIHCDAYYHDGDDRNADNKDGYSQCEDEKHNTQLTFFSNASGYFVQFIITDVTGYKHLLYDLQYTHDGIVEDVQGTGDIHGDSFTSDPIQLGTCSLGACIGHKDAHDFKLTITLQGSTYHHDQHDGKQDHDVSFRHEEE